MTAAFLAALAASLALRAWLTSRQMRAVLAQREKDPAAAGYAAARLRHSLAVSLARAVLVLLWTLGGGIDLLDRVVSGRGVPFLLAALFLNEIVLLPFAIRRVFGIEARFGFNRTTPRLFATDLLKEALLGGALAGAAAWAGLRLLAEPRGWILAWALWVLLSVLLAWAWPAWIAPLFHRFTPLPEGELGARLRALLERTGFPCRGVFVMDGSRRSTRVNAFLAGVGARRRIVLFDTLLAALDPPEVEAVLAHELGHVRLRHIAGRLLAGAAVSLAGFALLGLLPRAPSFFHGLGVERVSLHTGIFLFLCVLPLLTIPLRPLALAWSRRQEFAADAFAARNAPPRALASALVKLHERNAETLAPDRIWSIFHDSHPPLGRRVARIPVE